MYPGGTDMILKVPVGHGSSKVKREALDEMVLRVMEALRSHTPRITLPYCVFNGGTDAWLDIGNKRVGVEALQAFFKIPQANCLHVGDQVRYADGYKQLLYLHDICFYFALTVTNSELLLLTLLFQHFITVPEHRQRYCRS